MIESKAQKDLLMDSVHSAELYLQDARSELRKHHTRLDYPKIREHLNKAIDGVNLVKDATEQEPDIITQITDKMVEMGAEVIDLPQPREADNDTA